MPSKVKHVFVSAKADGADATLVRPSNWNADHDFGMDMTNRTGGALVIGDVCALDPSNNESVILSDVSANVRDYVVAKTAPANLALGTFAADGAINTKVEGAVTRLNYLRKSATTRALEDTGVSSLSINPPAGTLAIALQGNGAGSAVIPCFWLGGKIPAGQSFVDMTNRTGGTGAVGDVVAFDPANNLSVVLDDTLNSVRDYAISRGTPANLATGPYFSGVGATTALVDAGGATRLNWLVKSATTKALKDSGVPYTQRAPKGTIALALDSQAGSAVINVYRMPVEQNNIADIINAVQMFS